MSNSVLKIYPQNCPQQAEDYQGLMQAVDDIGAASLALASTGGAQAYSQFITAREDFQALLKLLTVRYRYVEYQ